jgi:hypothetical protein
MLRDMNEGCRITVRLTTVQNVLNVEKKKKNYNKVFYIAITTVYF